MSEQWVEIGDGYSFSSTGRMRRRANGKNRPITPRISGLGDDGIVRSSYYIKSANGSYQISIKRLMAKHFPGSPEPTLEVLKEIRVASGAPALPQRKDSYVEVKHAEVKRRMCPDCGRPTGGYQRCEVCREKHLKKWCEDGNEYVGGSYENAWGANLCL